MSDKELEMTRTAAEAAADAENTEGGEAKASRNFIEQLIDKDLEEGVYDTVHTRFPPFVLKWQLEKSKSAYIFNEEGSVWIEFS